MIRECFPDLRAVKLPFSREDILLWQSQYIFYSSCSISSLVEVVGVYSLPTNVSM